MKHLSFLLAVSIACFVASPANGQLVLKFEGVIDILANDGVTLTQGNANPDWYNTSPFSVIISYDDSQMGGGPYNLTSSSNAGFPSSNTGSFQLDTPLFTGTLANEAGGGEIKVHNNGKEAEIKIDSGSIFNWSGDAFEISGKGGLKLTTPKEFKLKVKSNDAVFSSLHVPTLAEYAAAFNNLNSTEFKLKWDSGGEVRRARSRARLLAFRSCPSRVRFCYLDPV